MKPEILAPAGGKEQLLAAVRSGADAVYLGASAFSARRNADNFSDDELYEAAAYCRERGVKVYAAVNILIGDTELPALRSLARRLYETGIDGVILQDLAAAKIFRDCCPDLALHASTQMTIHNRAGLRALPPYGRLACTQNGRATGCKGRAPNMHMRVSNMVLAAYQCAETDSAHNLFYEEKPMLNGLFSHFWNRFSPRRKKGCTSVILWPNSAP